MCFRSVAVAASLVALVFAQDDVPRWRPAPPLAAARANACAVRMADGRVLVTGGSGNEGPLASAEVFRPGPEEAFDSVPPMAAARSGHACVLLGDGRVLVAGGEAADAPAAEVYDLSLQEWTTLSSSVIGQRGPGATATLLMDGRVLLAGGLRSELEIFDPDSNTLERAPVNLASPRLRHTATLLGDGRVLIAGGQTDGVIARSAEFFDPVAFTLTVAPSLMWPRTGHTATLLFDGRVLVAGGTTGTDEVGELEVFTPERQTFEALEARLATPRQNHVAVLLPGMGGVLLAGGSARGEALGTSEIFEPWHDRVAQAGSLTAPRESMAAVALEDGTVLATGGQNAAGASRSCGVLRPTISFAFTQSRYHPGQRASVNGSFSAGSAPSVTVTLRLTATDLTTGAIVAVGDRLLTTSVTTRPDGTLPLTPIVILNRADIGRDFILTAFLGREALTQAKFTVRLPSELSLSVGTPVLTGQPIVGRIGVRADGSPVDFGGTLTFTAGTRSATQLGLSSVQTTREAQLQVCCEGGAGVVQATGRYSGNVFVDAASASTTVAIGNRTPTLRIAPTSLRLLQPSTVVVEAVFDPAAIAPGDPPRGNVTLRNNGVVVATLPLANNLALDSGIPRGALFSFTPSIVDRRKPPCFTALYEGDPRYNIVSSASTCIAVGPAIPALQPSVGASTTYSLGTPTTLSATLTWPDSVGIVGRTVNVTVGTTQIATITLTPDPTGKGIATGSTTAMLPFRTAGVTFTYPQSGDLGIASNAVRVSMNPISTTMSATVPTRTPTNPFTISYELRLNTGGVSVPGGTELGGAVQFFDGTELLGTHTPSPLISSTSVSDGTSNTIFVGEAGPLSFRGTLTNVIRPLGQRTIRVRFPGSTLFQAAEITVPVTVQ